MIVYLITVHVMRLVFTHCLIWRDAEQVYIQFYVKNCYITKLKIWESFYLFMHLAVLKKYEKIVMIF